MKIERTLRAYSNIIVKVVTDEDIEDMEWAVVTEDHGDEYLIVKTKDKKLYKYGCFANLKHAEYKLGQLMRKPEMYGKIAYDASNEICWFIDRNLYDDSSFRARKCYSKDDAQREFNSFINFLHEIHEKYDDIYDSSSHKDDTIRFLKENGIDTKENLEKLNSAPWDSRVDGINGIAGKDDISEKTKVYFENLVDAYVVDKDDLETVDAYNEDEWGVGGYYLNVEPDKRLNANKSLYALVFGEESLIGGDKWRDYDDDDDYWEDWMNNDEVVLSDHVTVLFQKTFIDEETGEALYLVIYNSGSRPVAQYLNTEAVMEIL